MAPMILAVLAAVASGSPLVERESAAVGSDPVDVSFCAASWVALADVSVVEGAGAPFGKDLLRAEVDEVLLVDSAHTLVPAALLAPVDGMEVTPGRALLVASSRRLVGSYEFHAINPQGPLQRVLWKGEYVDVPQWERFSAIPADGVVEHWTGFELRDGRGVTITHLIPYDDLLAEIRRRAPRLLDARKRFRRCGFRKRSEWLPERGVRLDPPEPSAFPPPSLPDGGP